VKVVPANEDEGDFVASRFGFLEGQFSVPDDFDRMFEDEIADMFEGKS